MSVKHKFLSTEDLLKLMSLLLDTQGKSLNDMKEEDVLSLFKDQIGPYLNDWHDDDEVATDEKKEKDVRTSDSEDEGVRYYLSESDKEKALELITKTTKDVIDELNKTLVLSLTFNVQEKNNRELDEFKDNVKLFSPLSFNKTYEEKNGKESIFYVGVHPSFITDILMDNKDPDVTSVIHNRVCEEYILDPFIKAFEKYSPNNIMPFLKESKLEVKTNFDSSFTFSDNILSFVVTLKDEDFSSSFFIALSEPLWLKVLGKKETYNPSYNWKKHNVYSVLYHTWINEEEIENLKEGQVILFGAKDNSIDLSFEKEWSYKPLIINNKISFLGDNVYNEKDRDIKHKEEWGKRCFIIKDKIDDEKNKKQIEKISDSNLFLVYAGASLTDEEINDLRSFDKISFDSYLNDLYPLLYKGKMIALCSSGKSDVYNLCKIVKVL